MSGRGHLRARGYRVIFAGDIGFGDHFLHHPRTKRLQGLLRHQGYGYSLDGLRPVLSMADYVIANLEAPLALRPNPALVGRKSGLSWSHPTHSAVALRNAGVKAVTMANDHALDCGYDGLRDTRVRLKDVGIESFGAGDTIADAARPLVHSFTVHGQPRTLVVIGAFEYRPHYDLRYRWYTNRGLPGVNPLSPKHVAQTIATYRRVVANPIFVVNVHWGLGYGQTNALQKETARALVEAGADFVIGHGSHGAQSVAFYKGRMLVYGLGNCVWNTPGRYQKEAVPPYSLLLCLEFKPDDVQRARLVPIVTDNNITGFQNRPTDEQEFAEAQAFIDPALRFGVGHFGEARTFEVPLPRLNGATSVYRLPENT